MHEELIAALAKATGDSAGLMLEAWEHKCRTSVDFRRYACTSVDEYGLTVTGRFCRYVDAGAFVSAALLMVPEGRSWMISTEEPGPYAAVGEDACAYMAATPALAICIAALKAKVGGEG